MPEKEGLVNPETTNPLGGSVGGSAQGQSGSGSDDVQSQLAALEERRRYFQGLADQRQAKLEQLEGELSAIEELKAKLESLESIVSSVGSGPSVEEIARKVAEEVGQRSVLENYKAQLGEKYPGVDVTKIQASTPEELEAAAQAKYEEIQSTSQALREQIEAEIRAKYESRFGSLGDDANADISDQGDRGEADGGAMTLEKFLSLSPDEEAALPDEVWERMIQEAHAKEAGETG